MSRSIGTGGACRYCLCTACLPRKWKHSGSGSAPGPIIRYNLSFVIFPTQSNHRRRNPLSIRRSSLTHIRTSRKRARRVSGGTITPKPPFPTTVPPTATLAPAAPNAATTAIASNGHIHKLCVASQIMSNWEMPWKKRTADRGISRADGN